MTCGLQSEIRGNKYKRLGSSLGQGNWKCHRGLRSVTRGRRTMVGPGSVIVEGESNDGTGRFTWDEDQNGNVKVASYSRSLRECFSMV